MKKRNLYLFIVVLCLAACVQEEDLPKENKLEDTLIALQEKGLTCEVQKAIVSFDEQEELAIRFRQMVSQKLSSDKLSVLVEQREKGCGKVEDNKWSVIQEITDNYRLLITVGHPILK